MKFTQNNPQPSTFPFNLSTEDRIKFLANIMVDRILEEEKKYKERLKVDPKAKRIYEK